MADFNIGERLFLQDSTPISAEYTTFNTLFNNILPNIYLAAGLVIFVMIVIGGFTILANSGNQEKTAEGAKTITSAIIGLLVLFASYWIIQIIQVVTGVQILNSTL